MLTLFHHPFCPHSRFVRLALGEYGITARTVEERVWERRQEFLILNPACTTPVAVEEGRPAIPGASIIAEYLDETRGPDLGELRLRPRTCRQPTIWATCHGTKTRRRRPGTRKSSRAPRSVRSWQRRWRAFRRPRPTPISTSERSVGAQASARQRRAPTRLRHRRH